MSIMLLSAAWDLDIASTEKMVLMCLCDFANEEGVCWPSVATIMRKTSKSERTVQTALKWLKDNEFYTLEGRNGTSPRYILDPRKICTPAKSAPPQKLRKTPAKSAPKPLRTTTDKNTKRALPKDWKPEQFGVGSQSREIVDSWSPKELDGQIEHFIKHHRGKGNRFVDWQDAWGTWVLNSRRWARPAASGERRAAANDGSSMLAHLSSQGP